MDIFKMSLDSSDLEFLILYPILFNEPILLSSPIISSWEMGHIFSFLDIPYLFFKLLDMGSFEVFLIS